VAYRALANRKDVRRIVLIGPSHRVYLQGAAVPHADVFLTPLGEVPIDLELKRAARSVANVIESDAPHREEHSLEVQLPFLQAIFGEFTLLPLVAGEASAAQVGAVLAALTQDDATIVLASSDLSHYLSYAQAERVDAMTSAAILRRDPTLTGNQACGAVPINGLLHLARARGLAVQELARCNSGDTAGDRNRVVGYGTYALYAA
jgi:AmmeMemoRadiSam system protein B